MPMGMKRFALQGASEATSRDFSYRISYPQSGQSRAACYPLAHLQHKLILLLYDPRKNPYSLDILYRQIIASTQLYTVSIYILPLLCWNAPLYIFNNEVYNGVIANVGLYKRTSITISCMWEYFSYYGPKVVWLARFFFFIFNPVIWLKNISEEN